MSGRFYKKRYRSRSVSRFPRKRSYAKKYYKSKYKRRYGRTAVSKRVATAAVTPVSCITRELGHVDLAAATYACDTTGSVTLIATIAQGVTTLTRVGKKITLKSLQIRGYCASNTATTVAMGCAFVVYDRRPTAAGLPAITDILTGASSYAFTNSDNQGRFSILWRRNFVTAGAATTPTTGLEIQDCNDFIKVNRPCVYKGLGTGAIGDIEEGALYLVTAGNQAVGTTACNVFLGFRTVFLDD